jgi:hypothetical protein
VPAKDHYHDTVISSLEKDGWIIEAEKVRLEVENRWLWLDMQAAKSDENRVILIEVKGFQNMTSPVDYLAAASPNRLCRALLSAASRSGDSRAVPRHRHRVGRVHGVMCEVGGFDQQVRSRPAGHPGSGESSAARDVESDL